MLRGIRYSEADVVLALFSRSHGRVSAIAKGARRTSSRLGGRLQPGVTATVTIHEGRGDLGTIRGASVVDAHAGLWVAGHRLQAAACVLETVMRVMPEAEPSEEAWHLLSRTLGLLARAPAPAGPPRLDPLVLGCQAKLLVVSGLLPMVGACARCGRAAPAARVLRRDRRCALRRLRGRGRAGRAGRPRGDGRTGGTPAGRGGRRRAAGRGGRRGAPDRPDPPRAPGRPAPVRRPSLAPRVRREAGAAAAVSDMDAAVGPPGVAPSPAVRRCPPVRP